MARHRGSQFVPISRLSSICAFLARVTEVPEANNWPFVIKEDEGEREQKRERELNRDKEHSVQYVTTIKKIMKGDLPLSIH